MVPSELGPDRYPQLEALKAQAIAARSYTLRNLGELRGGGLRPLRHAALPGLRRRWTPSTRSPTAPSPRPRARCWSAHGEPIDALYSATCGGHTENVEVVFPLKRADYLRGVPCLEAGFSRLPASASAPRQWPPTVPDGATPTGRDATFEGLQGGALLVRESAGPAAYEIGKELATFRDLGDGPVAGELALAAGDRLSLSFLDGRLAAVVQQLHPGGEENDREHARARWSRFRSDTELAISVRQRFPGFEFAGFDVVSRGPSGRVGRIRLLDRGGVAIEVAGLAVRWVLDVPDTLFVVRRVRGANGRTGWQFEGRGWGHGVGLCQVGAYGMARRGHDHRAILEHYYAGAELRRLEPPA